VSDKDFVNMGIVLDILIPRAGAMEDSAFGPLTP